MKINEIEALERHITTENKHWNSYMLEILCEELQQSNFENPETPLLIFDWAINLFTQHPATPLKSVQEFAIETGKANLNLNQKLFVYEWVYKYLYFSEFDEIELSEVKSLLKCEIERMKKDKPQVEYNKPLTGNIRDTLKQLMQEELEQLPNTLKELEPVQRLNIICKLIPYVLPKVESVTHKLGEPGNEAESNWFKW